MNDCFVQFQKCMRQGESAVDTIVGLLVSICVLY